jgi:hypothetical protein
VECPQWEKSCYRCSAFNRNRSIISFCRLCVVEQTFGLDQLGAVKPSTEEAKDYLRQVLAAAFPKADEVAGGVRVSHASSRTLRETP